MKNLRAPLPKFSELSQESMRVKASMKLALLCGWLVCCVGMATAVHAAVIAVGPDKRFKKPSEAAKAAKDGDYIQIDPGTYENDVAVWRQNDLFIYGKGGRPHLKANGAAAEGKAIWVIKGDNTKIANLEFSGATVEDKNGAGIRQEGTHLKIFGCYFHDNENGILAGENLKSEIVIEHSVFSNNGAGDGQSHNIYIGRIRKCVLRFCYVHHARIGHNVKCRAEENFILYNRLMDEVTGTSSYIVDFSNGGSAYMIGNLIQQGPRTDNTTLVAYAAEGAENSSRGFYIVNNTFVNDYPSGMYIQNHSKKTPATIINNIFIGPKCDIVTGPGESQNNLIVTKGKTLGNPGKKRYFVNPAAFDYRLKANSPAIDAGIDPGYQGGVALAPAWHYIHIARKAKRVISGKIDMGAYEFY